MKGKKLICRTGGASAPLRVRDDFRILEQKSKIVLLILIILGWALGWWAGGHFQSSKADFYMTEYEKCFNSTFRLDGYTLFGDFENIHYTNASDFIFDSRYDMEVGQ